VAALKINSVVIVWEAVMGTPVGYLSKNAANCLNINLGDYAPLREPKMQ
jgi:hypothetical protein